MNIFHIRNFAWLNARLRYFGIATLGQMAHFGILDGDLAVINGEIEDKRANIELTSCSHELDERICACPQFDLNGHVAEQKLLLRWEDQ